jgi:hypothetical protein
MEKMSEYRQIVRRIFEDYAKPSLSYPATGVEKFLIMDEDRGHYQLLKVGWHQGKRVEWMIIYARVNDGKIWVEKDLTEDGITPELLEAGVPKQDIVLAFHEPEMRQYTEFAVA